MGRPGEARIIRQYRPPGFLGRFVSTTKKCTEHTGLRSVATLVGAPVCDLVNWTGSQAPECD